MSKDFTIVPQDYIVHHIKTDDMLVHTKDGDYAYHVKTERIPLIRCRECKWYNCGACFRDDGTNNGRKPDDFCSYGSRSEKPNSCEHITEDGVTCAKYPACDDCPDNPLNKVKGSERLVKGSEKPNNCETCKHNGKKWYELPCDYCCGAHSGYAPKTEPQITMDCSKCECFTDGGERCDLCALGIMDEPQTDAEITELAKEIVHKMIDNSDIADDTYPDLKQRMHEAVEQLDEYYPSEDERSRG